MKRKELKNLIKENIVDWLSERAQQDEADSGDMAYTEKAPIKEEKSSFEDKVTSEQGKIFLVRKPTKDMTEGGIVHAVSLQELIGDEYIGAYKTTGQAANAGKKALKARDAKLKETYKKGQGKVKTLETTIDELKSQIESKMQEATTNPEMRESLTTESNSLLEKLTTLEGQVEKLKDALEKEGLRFEKKGKKKDTLASRGGDKEKDDSKKED